MCEKDFQKEREEFNESNKKQNNASNNAEDLHKVEHLERFDPFESGNQQK